MQAWSAGSSRSPVERSQHRMSRASANAYTGRRRPLLVPGNNLERKRTNQHELTWLSSVELKLVASKYRTTLRAMPRSSVPHGSSVYFQWRLRIRCALGSRIVDETASPTASAGPSQGIFFSSNWSLLHTIIALVARDLATKTCASRWWIAFSARPALAHLRNLAH